MDVFELMARISVDTKPYEDGLNDASKKTSSFGQKLSGGLKSAAKVGAAALGAVTTAGAVLGKKLVSGAAEVAAYGDNIDKMSQKMGISAQAYQEWDAVLQHSGTSIDSMSRGMQTLQKNAVNSADKFKKLGISEKQLASMSTEELFSATIKGLQDMGEGAERTALASELLGGSAKELGALLNTSAEDTQKMKDRVHELGGVMSDDAVKASAQFNDNLQDMKTAISGVKRGLASEFLPGLNSIMDGFTKLIAGEEGADAALTSGMGKINDAVSNVMPRIGELLSTILPRLLEFGSTLISGIAEQLPRIIGSIAQQLPGIAQTLITTAQKLIPRIKEVLPTILASLRDLLKVVAQNLPTLITQLITSFVGFIRENLDMVITSAVEIIQALFQGLIDNLPTLLDAGLQLLEAIIDGIINNIDQVVDAILTIITSLIDTIVTNLPMFLEKGGQIILKLVEGIAKKLPDIVMSIVNAITTMITTITEHLPEILTTGVQIIVELATGLVQAIPQLVAKIPEIIMAIVGGLLDPSNIAKIFDAGLQMIGELFSGLLNGDFLGALGDIGKALLGAVGAALGALFDLGKKIVSGILDGIKSAWDSVVNWVESGIEDLLGNPLEKYQDPGYDSNKDWWASQGEKDYRNAQARQAKNNADHYINMYKDAYKIHSPSKRMHDEVGKYIGQGLALGIQDGYAEMGGGAVDMSKTKFDTGLPSAQGVVGAGGGDIVIPVYIGQNKIEDIVVTAQQRANYRSGGR